MGVFGYLLSTDGRTGPGGVWLMTGLVLVACAASAVLKQTGLSAAPANIAFFVLLWPALIALPIRRFHDMGRAWWWSAVFLIGMLASFLFLMLDLTTTAGVLGLSAFSALTDTETYLQVLNDYNAASTEEPLEPVGAMGLGGVSLFLIFAFIEFGWLHLIPGNRQSNDYGPRPGAVAR